MRFEQLRSFRRDESDEELRARYVRYTDRLIARIQSLTTDDPSNVTCVFLDKSGRPVRWFVRAFWELMAGSCPRPRVLFANIDREQWQAVTGDMERSGVDVGRLDEDVFGDLRATYTLPDGSTLLDGRDVLVVDEVRTTGTTLEIARQLFDRAFPEIRSIEAHHWMYRPSARQLTTEVPVWYRADDERGRGVGNRDLALARSSPNARQRAGYRFLSNRFRGHDPLTSQLRREIEALVEDVRTTQLRISTLRDDDELAEAHREILAHWYPDVYGA